MCGYGWIFCLLIGLPVQALTDEGYFWHVTDFHYDFTYNTTDISCNGPVDHHGKFGDYWCDSPWKLAESAVKAMQTFKQDVDFLLWTGDSVLHAEDEHLSLDITDTILGNLTDLITNAFPSVPTYASFGNHDYFPTNQFPSGGNELYNRTLDRWKHWINSSDQHDNFLKGAYYTVMRAHGMRIVVLNTNLYSTSNKQNPTLDDPSDQFAWLNKILSDARTANEKVLLTAHIPPGIALPDGKPWFYSKFNLKLNDIIRVNSDVINGMFFGHEHSDSFRIYYHNDKPVAVQCMAPSVTPWRDQFESTGTTGNAHNPGVRLVKYDRISGEFLDITQYYMDLPESNLRGIPMWNSEYSFVADYKIADLSPGSLDNLVTMMEKEDGSKYFDANHRWRDVSVLDSYRPSCDKKCVSQRLCSFKHVDQDKFDKCMDDFANSARLLIGFSYTCILLAGLAILFLNHILF